MLLALFGRCHDCGNHSDAGSDSVVCARCGGVVFMVFELCPSCYDPEYRFVLGSARVDYLRIVIGVSVGILAGVAVWMWLGDTLLAFTLAATACALISVPVAGALLPSGKSLLIFDRKVLRIHERKGRVCSWSEVGSIVISPLDIIIRLRDGGERLLGTGKLSSHQKRLLSERLVFFANNNGVKVYRDVEGSPPESPV